MMPVAPQAASRRLEAPPIRTIGAVVINFNGGDRLLNTVAALRQSATRLDTIVVVDNGSTDDSPERLRQADSEVDLIALPDNRGAPAARNIGLARIDTELVLAVDSDVYVEPDCLRQLIEAYERERPAVVCPRVRLLPEREMVQADGAEAHFIGTMTLRHGFRPVLEVPDQPATVGGAISACLLLDRQKVLAAGGFDEQFFFYFEDHEFSLRLRSLGHRFVCEPQALVWHDRGRGTPGLSFRGVETYPERRLYLTLRNRWLSMLIHYRLRTLLVLAPALLLYEAVTFAFAWQKGHPRLWAKAWTWLYAHRAEIQRKRRDIQRRRCVPDRELLVGGNLPLAPGVTPSLTVAWSIRCLSGLLNGYWRVMRRLIG